MTASHWRQKQTNFLFIFIFFSSYNTSHSLTAPASTSWVTHVLFVATPTDWEYMCTVCGHYNVFCLLTNKFFS